MRHAFASAQLSANHRHASKCTVVPPALLTDRASTNLRQRHRKPTQCRHAFERRARGPPKSMQCCDRGGDGDQLGEKPDPS